LLGELGFFGAKSSWLRLCGMSNVGLRLMTQELERGDSGLRSFVSVQGALVMYPIHSFGSDAQKRQVAAAPASRQGGGLLRPERAAIGSNPRHAYPSR